MKNFSYLKHTAYVVLTIIFPPSFKYDVVGFKNSSGSGNTSWPNSVAWALI